ncbi:MAG: hypothetical protein AAGJ83_07670, partial [Planctomycetota bacterium]
DDYIVKPFDESALRAKLEKLGRGLTLRSSYRGQTLETKVHARPIGEGRFEWVRESSRFLEPGSDAKEDEIMDRELEMLLATEEE